MTFARFIPKSLHKIYQDYPQPFWTLVVATFIDQLGGAVLFPFFALYITHRFGVGMTEVGLLFAIFSLTRIIGGAVSGGLTDKFGRKLMLIFGLIFSALSSLAMGLIDNIQLLYPLAGFVGLFFNAGGPAQQAMVADLLPESKRPAGYGMIRVAENLAVTIGPAIGGLLATRSYLWLFIMDAVSSVITAGVVFLILPETKPEPTPDSPSQSLAQTFTGYGKVVRDKFFMAFILASILGTAVYMQMQTTLSVYLRDIQNVPEQDYGLLMSLNAALVVALQFWIARRISDRAPLVLMAIGTMLYGFGFGMYGLVGTFGLFALAMVIITIGEMIVVPTSQTLVAHFAPRDMRGRYMAIFGFSWAIPTTFGPLAAGLIMDNLNPDWVWYTAGLVAAIAALGYLSLHFITRTPSNPKVQPVEVHTE